MCKVFVEYTVKPEFLDDYLRYMQNLRQGEGRLQLLEGTDQPGLFVEIWEKIDYEDYKLMKERRKSPPHLDEVNWEEWLKGGLTKLHIWHFSEVK
jgi:hypothetical protein